MPIIKRSMLRLPLGSRTASRPKTMLHVRSLLSGEEIAVLEVAEGETVTWESAALFDSLGIHFHLLRRYVVGMFF